MCTATVSLKPATEKVRSSRCRARSRRRRKEVGASRALPEGLRRVDESRHRQTQSTTTSSAIAFAPVEVARWRRFLVKVVEHEPERQRLVSSPLARCVQ